MGLLGVVGTPVVGAGKAGSNNTESEVETL